MTKIPLLIHPIANLTHHCCSPPIKGLSRGWIWSQPRLDLITSSPQEWHLQPIRKKPWFGQIGSLWVSVKCQLKLVWEDLVEISLDMVEILLDFSRYHWISIRSGPNLTGESLIPAEKVSYQWRKSHTSGVQWLVTMEIGWVDWNQVFIQRPTRINLQNKI